MLHFSETNGTEKPSQARRMPSKSGLIYILIVSLYVAVYKSPKCPTVFYFKCIATYSNIDYHFFFDCLTSGSPGLKRQMLIFLFQCEVWGMTDVKCWAVSGILLSLIAAVFCRCCLSPCRQSLNLVCCVRLVLESVVTAAAGWRRQRPRLPDFCNFEHDAA